MSTRKYVIVILTGIADVSLKSLGGRTPLEAARTRNLDRISAGGRLALVDMMEGRERGGSETALLALLGYDTSSLRAARGPLEAAGLGVPLEPDDLALRINFVSTYNGILVDHSAGQIKEAEAAILISMLNQKVGGERVRFHGGLGYRNLLVLKGYGGLEFETLPPHEVLQQPAADFLPYGPDAGLLVDLLERANRELEKHDINRVRVDLGENPANALWGWGQGRDFSLPPFDAYFPFSRCLIAAVPLVRGIGVKTGFDVVDVPGATGGLDSDFAAKVRATLQALDRYDMVVLHVGAVNEACHEANPAAKIAAIQTVDARVVGPIFEGLHGFERWRLMIATDHITPSQSASRVRGPVPVAFCGHEIEGIRDYAFTEANAAKSDLFVGKGHTLMEFFLGVKRRKPA